MKRLNKIICIFLSMLICVPAYALEKVYFVYTDPAGTPLAVTNDNGAIVWKAEYKPFGEIYQEYAAPGFENNRMFISKEMDTENGLYYFGARHLESRVGRFVSPDIVSPVDVQTSKLIVGMLSNPQGFNKYAYGFNNPYKNADLDGKWPEEIHNRIIIEAFSSGRYNLGDAARRAMMAGSAFVDKDQDPKHSYMHAMRNIGEPPAHAAMEMQFFIREKIGEYSSLLSQGKFDEAYFALGEALHPIMDSTSPSHSGFQEWEGIGGVEELIKGVTHWSGEQQISPYMQITVDLLRSEFDRTQD
ncbi:MAG: RHS domain-containing protein [Deltaproteobacteria bacterium]|nr:RHS domain-containing protein [Deltaproteobacteria bacterium]